MNFACRASTGIVGAYLTSIETVFFVSYTPQELIEGTFMQRVLRCVHACNKMLSTKDW